MNLLYDRISDDYSALRRAEPAIEKAILNGLANARSVLNVGAGTGSYEPTDRLVVAVEPSLMMIGRRANSSRVVRGSATALPFRSKSFDAALAVLTVHHWPDRDAGLMELRRVARERVVVFTWDPSHSGFWLMEYLPEAMAIDCPLFPSIGEFGEALGAIRVETVEIPHDCCDGFMGAYWRRPEVYLDPRVRNAISTFSKVSAAGALAALEADLRSGEWERKYGEILKQQSMDLGYRLVVADIE